jgi:hypothetical protein
MLAAYIGGNSVSFDVGSLRVELYTADGIASGVVAGASRFREHIESTESVIVHDVRWATLQGGSQNSERLAIQPDDIIVAVAGEEMHGPVHATWHPIRLEAGPYGIEGELATMPGFDPGRALTRPSGEFVVLRDVRISLLDRPDAGEASYHEALINRYAVDKVDAGLMLGFFFPGAHVEPTGLPVMDPPAMTGAAATAEPASKPVSAGS